MDEFLYRPKQELDKIGPIYSKKDEAQRLFVEDIRNLRQNITERYKFNIDIPGLDKKKTPGFKNPASLRFWAPLSSIGRRGVRYVSHHHNVARFLVPIFVVLFFYYNGEPYSRCTYFSHDCNNYETETAYFKMQTFTGNFAEKSSLMA